MLVDNFFGIELILQNRDPRDAGLLAGEFVEFVLIHTLEHQFKQLKMLMILLFLKMHKLLEI